MVHLHVKEGQRERGKERGNGRENRERVGGERGRQAEGAGN